MIDSKEKFKIKFKKSVIKNINLEVHSINEGWGKNNEILKRKNENINIKKLFLNNIRVNDEGRKWGI